ncbi:MAG: hypothetical protein JRI83_11875 [Deltaproteobacteria bacterium]|nr:hypothetical protein [Deltaproteobacteria bacterium]
MKRFGLLLLLAALVLPAVLGCSSDSVSSQITLTTSKSSIPADGATTAEITATILGYDGEPVPIGTSVHFTTSRGLFTNGLQYVTLGTTDTTGTVKVYLYAPLKTNPGNANVMCTSNDVSRSVTVYAPLKTNPGNANVMCTSNDVSRSVTVEITLYGPPGETAKIELEADPASIAPDEISTITATLTDGNEDPVTVGTPVTFGITYGYGCLWDGFRCHDTIDEETRDISGTAKVYLLGLTQGVEQVVCYSQGVRELITVPIGIQYLLTVIASPTSIPADGATFSKLTATVTFNGTAVPGTRVYFETGRGEFSNGKRSIEVTTNSSGQALAYFLAPVGTQTGACQITVLTATTATPTPTS